MPNRPQRAGRWPDAAAKSVHHAHDKEFLRPPVMPSEKTRRTDLRYQGRRRQHGCWDQLIVAPRWVAYQANLGTLLRTCDAVGACIAVPATDHCRQALDRGDTLPRRPHVHWVRLSKLSWITEQRETSRIVVAVAGSLVLYRLAGLM
ncbi:MAG TPA: hypothetical protein VM388_14805 [Acidimicrobiales bacterium]|nr:hypothetical protein [Acidimicrobiales bacterium]